MAAMPVAEGPDQFYGWVIAFACFWINFVMAGLARTAGVLFVALIELYGVSREAATTPFSIRVCVRNMTGPLIGLLGLRFGIRKVVMLGVIIAALGSALCFIAPNIMWITIFWGGLHGMGFGLSTVIHMMLLSQYFDKYRASALGFAYSGDCFGTFVFPVIMENLLATFGVKGTFLLLGGIVLNVLPMALLLRKPPWLKSKKKLTKVSKNTAEQNVVNNNSHQSGGYQNNGFSKLDENLPSINSTDISPRKSIAPQFDDDSHENRDMMKSNGQVSDLKSELSSTNKSHRNPSQALEFTRQNSLPPVFEKENKDNGHVISAISVDIQSSDTALNIHDGSGDDPHSASVRKRTSSVISQVAQDLVNKVRSASFASQVAQEGFISSLHEADSDAVEENARYETYQASPESRPMTQNGNLCNNNEDKELVLSVKGMNKIYESTSSHLSVKSVETAKRSMFHTFIRTNSKPIFILISMSMAVYAFLFVGVLTIIIDYAVDQGVDNDHGKYLVIGFSVADLLGRLTCGQIVDRKLMKIKNYAGMTMSLMGIMVAVIPLNKNFYYMMACMCAYGLVQGGTAIMFPILVTNYMNKNEESLAMGCLNFYGGVLMLALAPMIGYFRDHIGSYNWVFHILGGMVLVIGLIWQTEPLLLKCQRREDDPLEQQIKKDHQDMA